VVVVSGGQWWSVVVSGGLCTVLSISKPAPKGRLRFREEMIGELKILSNKLFDNNLNHVLCAFSIVIFEEGGQMSGTFSLLSTECFVLPGCGFSISNE